MISYSYHLDAKNRGKVKASELTDFFAGGKLRPRSLTVKLGTGSEPAINVTRANNFQRVGNFLSKHGITGKDTVWVSITEEFKMKDKLESMVSEVVNEKADTQGAVASLTESISYKKGENVSVSHGIYAGFSGKISNILEGGFYEVEVENKQMGKIQVPGFALSAKK